MNILITGASTAQAYQLERILKPLGQVFLGKDESFPEFMKDDKYIQIPERSSSSFTNQLLSFCLDHDIKYVYPVFKTEILALSEAVSLFEEFGIQVMVPDLKTAKELLTIGLKLKGEIAISANGILMYGSNPEKIGLPETGTFVIDNVSFCLFTAD